MRKMQQLFFGSRGCWFLLVLAGGCETAPTSQPVAEAADSVPSLSREEGSLYAVRRSFRVDSELRPIGYTGDFLVMATGDDADVIVIDTVGPRPRKIETFPLIPEIFVHTEAGIFLFGESSKKEQASVFGRLNLEKMSIDFFQLDQRLRVTDGVYDERTERFCLANEDSASLIIVQADGLRPGELAPASHLILPAGSPAWLTLDAETSLLYISHRYTSSLSVVDLKTLEILDRARNPFGHQFVAIALVRTGNPVRAHIFGYDAVGNSLVLYDTDGCRKSLCYRDRMPIPRLRNSEFSSARLLAKGGNEDLAVATGITRRIRFFRPVWSDVLGEASIEAVDEFSFPTSVSGLLAHPTEPCFAGFSSSGVVHIACQSQDEP